MPTTDAVAGAATAAPSLWDDPTDITSAATAGDPSETKQPGVGHQATRDAGGVDGTPVPPGTATAATRASPTGQPVDAGAGGAPPPPGESAAAAGSRSLDEVAENVGLPADRVGGRIEDAERPVDVEGVQRAFGEHAHTTRDLLRTRTRGGGQ
jgi:hypothetical protein